MKGTNDNKDYLRLFLKREGKVVLGNGYSNVWLLTAVVAATFFAIAFSNASLLFLEDKMNDPFINWVDIKNDNADKDFADLESELWLPENAERFKYNGFEYGYEFSYFFFGKNDADHEYLRCRFFGQLNSDLVSAILSDDNVVDGMAVASVDDITDNSIGLIITEKAVRALGYEKAPAYVDLYSNSAGADTLGIPTFDGRGRAPLPVLGVVKRLPGNVDFISSTRFYQQNWNNIHTFNLNKPDYAQTLCYFVPSDVDLLTFEADLEAILQSKTEVPFAIDDEGFYPEDQFSFKNRIVSGDEVYYANYVRIHTGSLSIPYEVLKETNEELLAKYAQYDVHRLYPYIYDDVSSSVGAYLSVHFDNLSAIRDFQDFVNDFGVEIEMTQINAKENFESVRIMGGVLSWAMIIFSMVCIILFITNLLQSYFQKVKRNIGTFKAFGISNRELIKVYMVIMTFIVTVSSVGAFVLVLTVQELLPVLGVMKEGTYDYLCLFSFKTWCSILIIFVSSLLTVYRLMSKMLRCTPGDLIYER